MANIKGPGSMKAVELIAVTYPNNVTRDGKSRYLDVQVNAKDPRGPGQTNLHLVTTRSTGPDGKPRISNGAPYSTAQFEAIKEAAGDNVVTLPSGASVYAVKADLMPSSRKSGLVMNTKQLAPSELTIDGEVLDNQFASVAEAKAAKQAEATAVEAPAAEAAVQADAVQADATEPAREDEPALA
ncbi:hypothetical protein [Arthrobacter koreensis]|uniref:hypothetical protein n=1 Tax=Arthrobacter koreensis TaxID=199136 RepID=UPI003805A081